MPTPIARPPLSTPRPAAVAACVLLAALLNAGALAVAGGMATPAVPAAVRPHTPPMAPLRARVVMLSAAPQPMLAVVQRAPTGAPPAPAAPEPATRVPELAAPALASGAPAPDTTPQQLRLYGFDEVDVAAAPESDWALDLDALDAAGLTRLVFELMVNERGTVIACTVLDPTGLDDAVRGTLERQLAATRMRPAERGGRFVASVRRIELRVEAAY